MPLCSIDMSSTLTIQNELHECIVVLTYLDFDTVQLIPMTRTEVSQQSAACIAVDGPEGRPLRAHVCRLGLFGLTSPRTRLTSGQGFALHAGETYCIRGISADQRGNLCSVHLFHPVDGTLTEVASPERYRFGDKILKPIIQATGFSSLLLGAQVFENHMARAGAYHFSPEAEEAPFALQPAVCIPETEIWGVFFEQTWQAGIRAYRTHNFVTTEDLEMQEPYLFIGIPAVALMEMVLRSVGDPEGLIFIDGRRVTHETCVENFLLMFQLLMETKNKLRSIETLSTNEKLWLHQLLLYSSADKPIESKGQIYSLYTVACLLCLNFIFFRRRRHRRGSKR